MPRPEAKLLGMTDPPIRLEHMPRAPRRQQCVVSPLFSHSFDHSDTSLMTTMLTSVYLSRFRMAALLTATAWILRLDSTARTRCSCFVSRAAPAGGTPTNTAATTGLVETIVYTPVSYTH